MKKLKFVIYTRAFIFFAYFIIRLYSRTFRLTVINEDAWMKRLGDKKPVILCTWHQQFFSAIFHFKSYAALKPGLMISRSRDGELISGVARRTGWHTPRGSSSRGGHEAMKAMIDHINATGFGAHILDGPRGPIGVVKPGIIRMAQETGAVIVPFYTRADRAWFFNSWDRFMLPKPFARVTIEFEDPIKVTEDFESARKALEDRMLPGLLKG